MIDTTGREFPGADYLHAYWLARHFGVLAHVVNDRHIRGRAMIFTTNKHPKRWGDVLHDDDLADAIVDRILERGRLLRLDGPSVRTKHLPDDELRIDVQDNAGGGRVTGIEAAEFPERTGATRCMLAMPAHDVGTGLNPSDARAHAVEEPTAAMG